MNVRFAQTGGRDADETGVFLHFSDVAAAGVTHSGAQSADKLRDHIAERAVLRHAPFDAFRHKFLLGNFAFLTVAIRRTFFHRAD